MKRPTIVDVARVAGVSKSTVSHALSGKRPISSTTRRRILSAAAELGYQPHPVAQRLAGSSTRTIGCIFPLLRPQIGSVELSFINSATSVLNEAGYAFLLLTHMEHHAPAVERLAAAGLVDGLLLMQVHLHDDRIAWLRHGHTPFVMLGRCAENDGLPYVDSEIEVGLADAVAQLAAAGHRTIAYLHQAPGDFGFAGRALHGFQNGCRTSGVEAVLESCALAQEDGARAMEAVLDRQPKTSAAIVWNDAAALGALHAARQIGLKVPEEFALVLTNPTTLPDLVDLAPAVIDIRAEEMAARATQLLLDMCAGRIESPPQELIRPRLVLGMYDKAKYTTT